MGHCSRVRVGSSSTYVVRRQLQIYASASTQGLVKTTTKNVLLYVGIWNPMLIAQITHFFFFYKKDNEIAYSI